MDNTPGKLHRLFEYNFLEYTSYVIRERAIPSIEDGLKPVQRRILQTLFNMEDGRFHKVANVVGETMKLHPHGDQSIFAALVNLSNKGFLIERQGNFGNIYTGDQASAPRYIECRLSPLAKEILFNKDLTDFVDSYDGRMLEPVNLPAKIPLLLLQGAEGIAVGMATKIMPHNFSEMLEAQKAILRGEEFQVFPDFPQGGLVDVNGYNDGNGKIKCRACIKELNEKTIIIDEIPYTTTTQSLTDSIEKAAKNGKIKIVSINDYTAENVEIEIKLARGIYAKDTIKALYAFTDCEVSISPNLTLLEGVNPTISTVTEVLKFNTLKLKADLTKELEISLNRFKEKLHARMLEQIFIEDRLYKNIEEEISYESVVKSVEEALLPYRKDLLRDVTIEDIERLLEIRIKRISRFDINKQEKEIRAINKDIKATLKSLEDMVLYTTNYIDKILVKYGAQYPRKTEIKEFREVVVRKVALSNLVVEYQHDTGFLGHTIKSNSDGDEFSVTCSEYDRLLLIYGDGRYKIISVPDKVFIGTGLLYLGVVKQSNVFNLVYRDGNENFAYVKRFKTPKFILDKEYKLFSENKRSKILLLTLGEEQFAKVSVMPSQRAKTNVFHVTFDEYLVKGAAAKGKRVSPRVVRRVVSAGPPPPPKLDKNIPNLPGIEE
ncbi:MAG: DNA topoisomerase IV subunit A [Desulfotalea sp.]